MTEKDAIIALNMLNGIGYSRYKSLVSSFGSITAVLNASAKELSEIDGIGGTLSDSIANWKTLIDLQKELDMISRSGTEVITIIDEAYPPQLREIKDMPLCLYVRGKLNTDFNNTLAVVGSRKMTSYGREVCDSIVGALAYAGWTVVSGLAMGVDGAAHQAFINAKGKTIGVLGGGLARFHPQEHVELARKMIETGGGVITEFPMEFSPNKRSFPMRNRIISGLSRGVLVVEAGSQSGALITADFALEHNRQIFAVPGRINSPTSQGCNRLIKNGAKLVEKIEDIFDEFEFLPGFVPFEKTRGDEVCAEKDYASLSLSDDEMKIIDAIKLEEKRVDTIAAETAIPIGKLLASLQKLEVKKCLKQLPGKLYKLS